MTTIGAARAAQLTGPARRARPGDRPVPVGAGAVFLGLGPTSLHEGATSGEADYLAPSGRVTALGRATAVLPGPPGQVGLEVDGPQGATVWVARLRGPTGHLFTRSRPQSIPAGDAAVAVLAGGRLALRSGTNHLVLWDPATDRQDLLGPLDRIIAVSRTTLAWLGGAGCSPAQVCPLYLSPIDGAAGRLVAPPPGQTGFVAGGAFSPDGARLAAFAAPGAIPGRRYPDVQAVLIDPAKGSADPLGVPTAGQSASGQPVGFATWTPDGAWLLYGGTGGVTFAYRPLPLPPHGYAAGLSLVDLSLPDSWGLAVL